MTYSRRYGKFYRVEGGKKIEIAEEEYMLGMGFLGEPRRGSPKEEEINEEEGRSPLEALRSKWLQQAEEDSEASEEVACSSGESWDESQDD